MKFASGNRMKSALLLLLSVVSVSCQACPFCNTTTAAQIRDQLTGPDLFMNILVLLLPFFIAGIAIVLVYTGKLRVGRKQNTSLHQFQRL